MKKAMKTSETQIMAEATFVFPGNPSYIWEFKQVKRFNTEIFSSHSLNTDS